MAKKSNDKTLWLLALAGGAFLYWKFVMKKSATAVAAKQPSLFDKLRAAATETDADV